MVANSTSVPGDLDPHEAILRSIGESQAELARAYRGPTLNGARLGAETLRERASAEAPAWWDQSVQGVALKGVDLRGLDLRAADLSGASLADSDLSDAKGPKLCMAGAHLERARFDRADLAGADLSGAIAGESSFAAAMLEDALLVNAKLRFADLRAAVLDGTQFDGADLWGVLLDGVEANNASFRHARLNEATLVGADLSNSDLQDSFLKRADLRGARLVGADLRNAKLDDAQLDGADLSCARLVQVALTGCSLRHIRIAGAWLDGTQMHVEQLGGAVGEEIAGEFEAAANAYGVLERNFVSLGDVDAASWAYCRRRRMGKQAALQRARACWRERRVRSAVHQGAAWANDVFVEWLCDYGESLPRVARAFGLFVAIYALFYGVTASLARTSQPVHPLQHALELVMYSLGSMTTGTGGLELKPSSTLAALVVSTQSLVGPIMLGLFGFVLGNIIRR